MKPIRSTLPLHLLLFILLSIVTTAICLAENSEFSGLPEITDDSALVVLYRPKQFVSGGGYPFVYVDGQKRAKLKNGRYLLLTVTPGEHEVVLKNPWLWDGKQSWSFTTKPKQTYIYRVFSSLGPIYDLGSSVVVTRDVAVRLVPKDAAYSELAKLKKSKLKKK